MSGLAREWRFIDDGPHPGSVNMATDEALASCASDGGPPTLRVYRFSPPCVTLGRSQELPGGIDLEVCRRMGIELVKRPTGGLAILHLDDFTYSFTSAIEPSPAAGGEVFDMIARGIIHALGYLGLEAEVARHHGNGASGGTWCFDAAFGIDLESSGRKVCGSAQRLFRESILQHGSLFLADRGTLPAELTGQHARSRSDRTVSLGELLSRDVTWLETREAFRQGFAGALGIRLVDDFQTDREKVRGLELIEGRYSRPAWTWPPGGFGCTSL